MMGDDATRAEGDPRGVERSEAEPTGVEPLHRVAAPFRDSPAPEDLPWTRAPTGRRISFVAWGVAVGIGILLWLLLFKLFL
jgi:hypothetical protein